MKNKKKAHVYISHSIRDGDFVKKLRKSLEQYKISVWEGSNNIQDNDSLRPEVESAIENAKHTIAVLSLEALNSAWVQNEIQKSNETEKSHSDGYKTIPILLPGIKPPALRLLFGKEPEAITIENPENLNHYIPDILSALGEKEMEDIQKDREVPVLNVKPVSELILELSGPLLKEVNGEFRACAQAQFLYDSKAGIQKEKEVKSKPFSFQSPFGAIEFDNITRYLEEYSKWSVDLTTTRTKKIEKKLEIFGNTLYKAVFNSPEICAILDVWKNATDCDHLLSIRVNKNSSVHNDISSESAVHNAASQLLSIPWELIHDGETYLSQSAEKIEIKRTIPFKKETKISISKFPVKILLVAARMDEEYVGYPQYQAPVIPLLNTFEKLGKELISLTILSPATFPSMIEEIKKARWSGSPYDVVHFYSYCSYNKDTGMSSMSFEDPKDLKKLYKRGRIFVNAKEISKQLIKYKIPIVFLENRQIMRSDTRPTTLMATTIIEKGISSVITMTYPGLVSTTSKFIETFYTEILQGSRVGKAVHEAQCVLAQDTFRIHNPKTGNLHLNDWFVPVLYQNNFDTQLFSLKVKKVTKGNAEHPYIGNAGKIAEQKKKMKHAFTGRSKELLALEQLLTQEQYAMIYGMEGVGKTAVAVELMGWFTRTEKIKNAVYISVENITDINAVINDLGQQLIPESKDFNVKKFKNKKAAIEAIQKNLNGSSTVILFDQVECILPDYTEKASKTKKDSLTEHFFTLCKTLLASKETRCIFTTREKIQGAFGRNGLYLDTLPKKDAIELVCNIFNHHGKELPVSDTHSIPEEVESIVDSLNCHTRALTLITHQIAAQRGLTLKEDLKSIMENLHKEYPHNKDKSLYSGIEYSIGRLPEIIKEKIHFLSLFHGGVHLGIWAQLLKIENMDTMNEIKECLINVGLAKDMEYNHIEISPVLSFYLLSHTPQEKIDTMKISWAVAMIGLINYLYDQESRNINMASHLTMLELRNFLSFLEYMNGKYPPEDVVLTAAKLEQLITPLNQTKVLEKVIQIREKADKRIKKWSKAAFESERMKVEQFIQRGNFKSALDIAKKLLFQSLEEGEGAYPRAEYDIAMAYDAMGTVLKKLGFSKKAIGFLDQAILRFKKLVIAGNESVEHMVASSINEKAECLIQLEKLSEAERMYHHGLQICNRVNDQRAVAVWKWNLSICLIKQKKYTDALTFLNEAKKIMELFKESESVAGIDHQIGIAYENTGDFNNAISAYQSSINIFNGINDKAKECVSLLQLGNLYLKNEHYDKAVPVQKQVCAIKLSLNDVRNEGKERSSLANTLIKINRYDEALDEVNRAIECNSQCEKPMDPWFPYSILCFLHVSKKNAHAANEAWKKAFSLYLHFRKTGGSGKCSSVQIIEMYKKGLEKKKTTELVTMIEQYAKVDAPEVSNYFFSKLNEIHSGNRKISLAKDMGLFFMDAVELYLLIEWLIEKKVN